MTFCWLRPPKRLGQSIRTRCEVLDVITHKDKVELITSKGALLARFALAADGSKGVMARKTGWQETRHLIPALGCEVFVGDGSLERFRHAARFNFGIVPFGYAWIFPKKEHLSVGVLSMRTGPIKLGMILERYLNLKGLISIKRIQRHGFLMPVSPRKDEFTKGRVILTGDAAGLAGPLTGEGITFAVLSGQIAAKALLEGAFEETNVREVYESDLSERILQELRLARVLERFFYVYPEALRGLFRMIYQFYRVKNLKMSSTRLKIFWPLRFAGLWKCLSCHKK